MKYRNAKYANDNGIIDCEIEHPKYGWIPYTLTPDDTDTRVDNSELLSAMTKAKDVAAFVPPTQDELDAIAAADIRSQRDMILGSVVDSLVSNPLRWADLTAEKQQEWIDYRRSLLDITIQAGFPHSVDWPTEPQKQRGLT